MDFLTVLKYVLAIIETGALIGAMVFSAKGMREHKDKEVRQALLKMGGIFFAVYVVLNMIRMMYFEA